MAIPDFQSLMLPLLQHLGDGRERTNSETYDALADVFSLDADERAQLLPSGRQSIFVNRVAWAKVHLKAANLIDSPTRAVYRITTPGQRLLEKNPDRVDLALLRTFPEYREWRSRKSNGEEVGAADSVTPQAGDGWTPEEHLEYGYQKLRDDLAEELLERAMSSSPSFFERLVVDLLVAMGYGGSRRDAGQTLGRSGDGGVDGIIKEDRLGLDVIYIQAKRWEGTVGRPEIQKFAGALQGYRAKKGVFITTSDFSNEARDYAENIDMRIILLNGERLASLMVDHGVGVSQAGSYEVKRIDLDYFEEP